MRPQYNCRILSANAVKHISDARHLGYLRFLYLFEILRNMPSRAMLYHWTTKVASGSDRQTSRTMSAVAYKYLPQTP